MLGIKLKLKLKNGKEKIVIFEKVTDLYIDYANNKLSLFDYDSGVAYEYHFKSTGKERDGEAMEILHMEILTKEE